MKRLVILFVLLACIAYADGPAPFVNQTTNGSGDAPAPFVNQTPPDTGAPAAFNNVVESSQNRSVEPAGEVGSQAPSAGPGQMIKNDTEPVNNERSVSSEPAEWDKIAQIIALIIILVATLAVGYVYYKKLSTAEEEED